MYNDFINVVIWNIAPIVLSKIMVTFFHKKKITNEWAICCSKKKRQNAIR